MPISLFELKRMDRASLVRLSQKIDWYHVIDFGDGVITDGAFDIRSQLEKYGIPENLVGKSVLDVGRASGFFSFEFERRGADVTATDLPSPLDKDYVGGSVTRELVEELFYENSDAGEGTGDRLDFFVAHTILKSKVRPIFLHVADLSPQLFGGRRFDIVFVGSLLNHLKDPIGALEKVLSVCNDLCIVATPYDMEDTSSVPKMRLIGRSAPSLSTWWLPNIACVVEMLHCAGFDDINIVSKDLILKTRHQGAAIPHVVVHARTPDQTTAREKFEEILRKWKPEVARSSKHRRN